MGSDLTFAQVNERLDAILGDVRSQDSSLEQSLDLMDEALDLGMAAIDLLDSTEFAPSELVG